jgi:hypothetical protein
LVVAPELQGMVPASYQAIRANTPARSPRPSYNTPLTSPREMQCQPVADMTGAQPSTSASLDPGADSCITATRNGNGAGAAWIVGTPKLKLVSFDFPPGAVCMVETESTLLTVSLRQPKELDRARNCRRPSKRRQRPKKPLSRRRKNPSPITTSKGRNSYSSTRPSARAGSCSDAISVRTRSWERDTLLLIRLRLKLRWSISTGVRRAGATIRRGRMRRMIL